MPLRNDSLRILADTLIAATNAFDVNGVLALFTPDAVIDDPSTGHRFEGACRKPRDKRHDLGN
ncbi:hypothetical protein GCM10027276_13380 [Comamonas piscis]